MFINVFLRIARFLDFAYRPGFQIAERSNVSETGSFHILTGGEGDVYSVGALRKSLLGAG
jgi:hypothetical protein